MPIARNGDVDIYYEVRGSGVPLLLIMGYRASGAMWSEEFVTSLVREFQVITIDNRGTGNSDKPYAAHTIATMAHDAVRVLDELDIEIVRVFGVSMGGMIAQEFALHFPQRVDRLVLGCTTCGGHLATPATWAVRAQLFTPPNLTREDAVRRQWNLMFSAEFIDANPALIDQLTESSLAHPSPPHSAMRQAMAIQWFDAGARLGRIAAPTLVVVGDADVVIPPANSYLLAAHIPDCELEVLPDAGHGFFWQRPQQVADLLTAFCRTA